MFSWIKLAISHPQNELFCEVIESLFIVVNVHKSESVSIALGNNHCSWLKDYTCPTCMVLTEILQNSPLFISFELITTSAGQTCKCLHGYWCSLFQFINLAWRTDSIFKMMKTFWNLLGWWRVGELHSNEYIPCVLIRHNRCIIVLNLNSLRLIECYWIDWCHKNHCSVIIFI